MNPSQRSKLRVDKKKTAAFAGAVAASTAMAPAVDAMVVPVVGAPLTISATGVGATAPLDVDGVGPASDLIFFVGAGLGYAGRRGGPTGGLFVVDPFPSVLNLASGFTIGPTLATGVFSSAALFFADGGGGAFNVSSTGVAGFSFVGQGNVTQYGWLRIHMARNLSTGFMALTVLNGAYDNSGAPIQAPAAVPEPSSLALGSLGLLALGAAGLRDYRRRKKNEPAS